MIDEQFFNSGELDRGVFDPFYGKYRKKNIRNKIVSGTDSSDASGAKLEFSIYDSEKNLRYWKRGVSYEAKDGNFEPNVFSHIQNADIPDGGNYILRYNFFFPELEDKLYVKSISNGRREVVVRPQPEASDSFKQDFLSLLKNSFKNTSPNNFQSGETPLTYVGNLGENEYYHILNWSPVVETKANGDVKIKDHDPVFSGEGILRFETPVGQNVEVGDPLRIDTEASRPYFDRFEIFRSEEITAVNTLAGPDFTAYGTESGQEGGFESLEEITQGDAFETSKNFIQSKISGSKAVDLNVDFTEFENFIQYSSAEERIRNFEYKIRKIYQNVQDLKELDVPGGQAEVLKEEIESVIGSFDAYENWLFRNENGYPKDGAGSLKDPDEARSWFEDNIRRAQNYDGQNDSALRSQVPEFVRENPENDKFLLFVDMIGHWFDVNWLYIRHIGNVSSTSENAFDPETLSPDLSNVVAESFGFETYNGFDAEEFFDEIFDKRKIESIFDGADVTKSGAKKEVKDGKVDLTRYQAQQQVWRRLLRNLIHFYKNKGAPDSISAITSVLGIPSGSLIVRESGGALPSSQKTKLEESSRYLSFSSSQSLEVPFGTRFEKDSNGIEMRFRSEFQGGRTLKLFEVSNVLELRVEKAGLNTERARFVLEFQNVSGSNEILKTKEVPAFNGEWTNLLLQLRKDDPAIEFSVRQRSPFGNLRFSEDLIFKTGRRFFSSFYDANSAVVGGNAQRPFTEGISFIGDIDQMRVWSKRLPLEVFEEHVNAPKKYNSESKDAFGSSENSFGREELLFRTEFVSEEEFPEIKNLSGDENAISSGFSSEDFNEYKRTNFFPSVQIGNTSYIQNKVRIKEGKDQVKLYPDRNREATEQPISGDNERLGIFFSPITSANRDAISEVGVNSLNEALGDPRDQVKGEYRALDGLRISYWEKYDTPIDTGTYVRYIDQFYGALFDHIEKTVPARASSSQGVVIEPSALERNRQRLPTGNVEIKNS